MKEMFHVEHLEVHREDEEQKHRTKEIFQEEHLKVHSKDEKLKIL